MNIILHISTLPLQNSIIHPENYYTLKTQTKQTNQPNAFHPKNTPKEKYQRAFPMLTKYGDKIHSMQSLGLQLYSQHNIHQIIFFLKCYKESQLNIKRPLHVISNLLLTGTVCLIHQICVDLEVTMNHILN